jgi:DNA-binding NtrC family response regulator
VKYIKKKVILVIDDDAGMLRALYKVLSGEGAIVICADWAGDGIDILGKREQKIDLVITDLRMPFVNGMTVVRAVHAIFPALPVIVLTAFASPEVREVCLEQGAVAFLEKPLDTAELIAAVRTALNARQAAGAANPGPADILASAAPVRTGKSPGAADLVKSRPVL